MTTVHVPMDVRLQKQCRVLSDAGYDVTLLAACDSPPAGSAVPVKAIPKARNRPERMLVSTRNAYRAARALKADIYHFHDPELIPVGAALKRRGARVVYDVHEDYPAEILTKPWIEPRLRKVVSRASDIVERGFSRHFDLIVTATSSIAERFPHERTVVVQNFPDVAEMAVPNGTPMAERARQVAYVGELTEVRGAYEMVQAVTAVIGPVELHVAGRMSPPSVEDRMRELDSAGRVRFLGFQGRPAVRDLLAASRAGLVVLHPTPNHVNAQPTKLFEYMAADLPVVASDFPLWREIIGGVRSGILVNPLDPDAIASAITWLLDNPDEAEAMGRRGCQAVLERYNWDREGAALVAAYARLV